ncbi:hypothetical protein CR513_46045, partial [Mucuna pruriens]
MPHSWNTNTEEQQTTKGQEQAGVNNARTRPTQRSRTGPTPTSGAEWTNWADFGNPKGDPLGRGKIESLRRTPTNYRRDGQSQFRHY